MYKLVIADDEGSKSTVPIIRDEITIGRKDGNTIRLTERNVSRHHAKVVRENGRVYVEDVAARYGIKKNGVKIAKRAEFAPGDIVSIGDYQLTLKAQKSDKAPGAAAKPPQKQSNQKKSKPAPKKKDEGTQVLPAMPAKLVVISSNFAGQEFPLNRKEMIIGRGEDCDIIIDHRSVSQKHAKVIRETGAKYQIVDLNSKNGVSIGGEQYRAVHIKRGDVIELGHVKFRFVEPGENYVFTPQPSADETIVAQAPSSSNKGMMIGAVVVIAALVGAALFFMMGEGDGGQDIAGGEQPQALAQSDQIGQGGANSVVPVAANEEKAPEENKDDKVDQAIAEARAQITAGELDQAIGALESAKKYLEPSPAQDDKIAELMGAAKTERPFKQDYQSAKDNIQSNDYDDALVRLSEIPKHSVFHKIYTEEGLIEQAVDGLVTMAEDALDSDDEETARALAEEALVYDDEHQGAKSLLDALAREEEEEKARLAANTKSERSGSRASSSRSGASGSASSRKASAPARTSVSAAEAKELFQSATKKLISSGNPDGAIQDCKKALSAGQSGCYRIIAMAYKMKGNNGAACSNFQRYLGTNPGNAVAVQRQMEQLGCN